MKREIPTVWQRQRGVSLIELLVAMTLGLVVLGAVINIFLANRESYRALEATARMQENARFAFEVLGRSLRAAGGIPCGVTDKVANVINGATDTWWANWANAVRGYDGTESGFPKAFGADSAERVSGTDAVVVVSGSLDTGVTITEHNPTSAQFKVNTTAHGLVDGDIVMVCDQQQAAIFQVTNANSSNVTIVHNAGGSVSPGNCSKGLGYPTQCTPIGNSYPFANGGMITKLASEGWYVGNNPRGARSLYRVVLQNSSGKASATAEEVIPNVWDLQLTYLVRDASGALASDYAAATGITDWTRVVAVRVELTTYDPEVKGTDGQALQRTWYAVFTLRNRMEG